MREIFQKLKALAWYLPGFLLWAAYPPYGEKIDVLFALAPLLWLSRHADAWTSTKRWFQSGLLYWVATLSWMPAIVKNGGPWPLVVLGWFALACYCSLFFAAFGYLSARLWRGVRKRGSYALRVVALILGEPILWCGLELLRSRLFGGFAWNQLGVVPVNGGFASPAAVGGVYLLSAVVILVNGSIAGIIERFRREVPRFAAVETLLAFGLVWGVFEVSARGASVESVATDPCDSLRVALIQRNFPCVFRRQSAEPLVAYSNLLARVSMLSPELVVLSESALCEAGEVTSPSAAAFVRTLSEMAGGAVILTGGSRRDLSGREYNSAALYAADGGLVDVVDKVHLVPFGEYIPGDKWITALQALAPVGSCTPGELRPLASPHAGGAIPLGVAICFEDTDSAQMRKLVQQGARALVFITNDSWFSRSIEPLQHAWQAVARAVETGLPIVRVGNSGVSGTISPTGEASWLIGSNGQALVDRAGSMFDRVMLKRPQTAMTPYTRFGDIPLFVLFSLTILIIFLIK